MGGTEPGGGVPFVLLAILLGVIPGLVVLAFGMLAFRRVTPLVFVCRRCDRDFHGKAHRGSPARCPSCGATDWNLTDAERAAPP